MTCVGLSTRTRYDPPPERFLTRDPALAMTHQPYAYAGNDPVNWSDPLGLWPWDGKCVTLRRQLRQHQGPASGDIQKIADGAGGVLDTISGGNADLILENVPGDQSTKVRWGSNSFQTGRVLGHGVMSANLPAYLASTTGGAGVNAVDTTYVCLAGRGGPACGADVGGAWFGVPASGRWPGWLVVRTVRWYRSGVVRRRHVHWCRQHDRHLPARVLTSVFFAAVFVVCVLGLRFMAKRPNWDQPTDRGLLWALWVGVVVSPLGVLLGPFLT